ncbi:MAG: ECF transporter S component [Rikenellaceae bacterium]
METTLKLYSLRYTDVKAYLYATLFIAGNLVAPQIAHLAPQGGVTWLPIYLFTLIGAYKYGWRVGLLTALLSPMLNHLLFGMPALAVLPAILLKSTLLALIAGFVAQRFKSVSLLLMAVVVLSYQVVGTLGEWAIVGSLRLALQDFRIGIPGMLLQIVGGYSFVKYILRR